MLSVGEAGGDMGDEDLGGDLGGDEDAAPEGGGEDLGGEEEGEDADAMLQEALSGISYVPSQKEIVSTVAKRVAKRLQEAKRAEAQLNRALGKRR